MKLLTFDPGFDVTGWATFHLNSLPSTMQEIIAGLTDCGQIATDPKHPIHHRMHVLGMQVRTTVIGTDWDAIAIEMPAYSGDYGDNRGRRASVNKLYMAVGAILAHTAGEEVIPVPALTVPKETRHELLSRAAEMAGVELPTGPRGGKHEDAWDAIFLGCQLIMDRGAFLFAQPKRNPEHLNERAV